MAEVEIAAHRRPAWRTKPCWRKPRRPNPQKSLSKALRNRQAARMLLPRNLHGGRVAAGDGVDGAVGQLPNAPRSKPSLNRPSRPPRRQLRSRRRVARWRRTSRSRRGARRLAPGVSDPLRKKPWRARPGGRDAARRRMSRSRSLEVLLLTSVFRGKRARSVDIWRGTPAWVPGRRTRSSIDSERACSMPSRVLRTRL